MAKLLILLMAFLTDGPDSYNPVQVNRLHKHVLFQSVLTTLLAVVNSWTLTSPMETDNQNSEYNRKE